MGIKSYLEAKNKFITGDYETTQDFFKSHGHIIEYGYCKLLEGDYNAAKMVFAKAYDYDFRANWAKKLIQFIEGQVYNMPSYFQIRNFLEIDLNLLIKAQKPDMVENIINGADLFYSVNQESYKFIARVMLFNDFDTIALHYLNKAKDKFYYDPEMHLMMANCYQRRGETKLAKLSANTCLSILPSYTPAKKLLEKLNN